jgi:Transcriptional regulators
MRPTARDLAKAAGVSLATVDRVLNHRPNVSAKAVTRVNEAIERIGFVPNQAAVTLARNTVRRFRFVLPGKGDQYLGEIMREIRATDLTFRADMVSVDIAEVEIEDPHLVANYLASIAAKVDGLAIMAPESPQVRDALRRLEERGIHIVRFLSGKDDGRVDVVGIDNHAAGATAARLLGRFAEPRAGTVMVIADTMRAQDSIERRLGFDRVMNLDFPNLRVLPSLETHSDPDRTRSIISRQLKHNGDIVGVYVMSSEARVPLTCLAGFTALTRLVVVAHERTPFTVAGLQDGSIDAVIAQNPGHAVRSAVRLLKARSDNLEPVLSRDRLRVEVLLKDNL